MQSTTPVVTVQSQRRPVLQFSPNTYAVSRVIRRSVKPAISYHKEVRYDRETRDFAMYLNGELVGYAPSYLAGELHLNGLVYDILSRR